MLKRESVFELTFCPNECILSRSNGWTSRLGSCLERRIHGFPAWRVANSALWTQALHCLRVVCSWSSGQRWAPSSDRRIAFVAGWSYLHWCGRGTLFVRCSERSCPLRLRGCHGPPDDLSVRLYRKRSLQKSEGPPIGKKMKKMMSIFGSLKAPKTGAIEAYAM